MKKQTRRILADISIDLAKSLKIALAIRGITITDFILEAVNREIEAAKLPKSKA